MTDAPRIRILICDDDPDFRELLRVAMAAYGDFEVVGQAGDGRDALKLARELQPDIVLLDVAMPHMDELRVISQIRAAAPRARIVVLSGFDAASLPAGGRDLGVHGYLVKGINPRELARDVAKIATGSKGKILLVEDSTTDAELYGRALVGAGLDLTTVHNGEAALAQGRNRSFDLVVLDINLPDMTGLEVLRRLAGDARYTPVPVAVILTGEDPERHVQGALKLGAAAVLTKSKTAPEELARRVLGWLEEGAGFRAV
jgi:DNA-binding NarL/FixJ family response regulator